MNNINVMEAEAGDRLDNFLVTKLPELSRSQIQKLIKNSSAKLNNRSTKPSAILKINDIVSYSHPVDSADLPLPERGDIKIVSESDDFIIINKPSNLVVHPAHANKNHTLVNYLLELRPEIAEAIYDPNKAISLERPGIVHRLDKDTSGLLIVAKNHSALKKLSKIIHNHKLGKTYLALVLGWPEENGTIQTFLKRSDIDRRKMETHKKLGKEAITNYQVEQYYTYNSQKIALVKLKPITGRTHQLRVHLKSIGHPVIGDQIYNNNNSKALSNTIGATRQQLHASELKFRYNNKTNQFTGELPDDFSSILLKLKESNV